MKKYTNILLFGDDGKVSWTKVLIVHALIVFWTVYLGIFFFGIQLEEAALAFFTEMMILFIAPRPFQRALTGFKGGLGMNTPKEKDKDTPLEELKTTEKKVRFIRPCVGTITSLFRTPKRPKHHGIDIAERGAVEIVSVADGVVVKAYNSSSYGQTIIVQHDGVQTLYAHLAAILINKGDVVTQGQTIGMMGNTGKSRGQHLHFEMHLGKWNSRKSNAVDPLTLIEF